MYPRNDEYSLQWKEQNVPKGEQQRVEKEGQRQIVKVIWYHREQDKQKRECQKSNDGTQQWLSSNTMLQ